MSRTAIINGERFTLLEQLPALDGGSPVIVCQNDSGERFACTTAIWENCAERAQEFPAARVTLQSSSEDKLALFRALFRGREDAYAKRWQNLKTGQSGYSPACKNEWERGLCNKKNLSCSRCPNREFLPLTDAVIYRHLEGKDECCRDVVGLYPMLPDETVCLLAVDFDGEGWMEDVAAIREVCTELELHPAVERSRSGNGGHVWFFFDSPIPASDARKLGSGLLTLAMARRSELKMQSYDRLFPNQDTLPRGGFGNLIALPLQGHARKAGNSVFVDERFEPWPDQWAFLSRMEKLTSGRLDELLHIVCKGGELGDLAESAEEDAKPWERRLPQKLTQLDFPNAMELTLADGVYVKKDGISQPALNRMKRLAAFRNPDFYKAQAMRLPTYNKPRVIDTSENLPEYLKLPRGCLGDLQELIPAYSIADKRNTGRPINVTFNGLLRDEQLPAAEAMLTHDTGVLSATTAFGKTVVGAYLIGARKVNTLVLVHSSALLAQWKTALEQFLVIGETLPLLPPKRGRKKKRGLIGQLGAGKNTLSGIVDIAIMQSLLDGTDVKALVRDYGLVICDECHHVPAVNFERVLSAVMAKYVCGLTATPLRVDGHQPIIFMQCGPIRYRLDAKKQAEKRAFEHFIIPRFTSLRVPDAAELTIQELYAKVVAGDTRNRQISKDARRWSSPSARSTPPRWSDF